MGLYYFIVAVALVAAAWADESCPDPESLKPCTCDGEGVNCMAATSLDQIKKAFQVKFKYGGVRSVWVQGTPITSIPAGLFGSIKSQQFYIEINNVTTVDMAAFSASKKTLHTLSLFGNKIVEFPFKDLEPFEMLGTLNLGRNKIRSLPDNAFQSRSLGGIILAQNDLSHIGRNAFAGLPSLRAIEISGNRLATLGPQSFASPRHSASLQINLASNELSQVDATAFEGLDPYGIYFSSNRLTSLSKEAFSALVTKIAQKEGFLELSGNPLSCRGCDYSWLVLNKDLLYTRLYGFTCPDGTGLMDLTDAKIGCNSRRALF
ncbi:leucine-rich repeat-containing protein 15-like [Uloborus diversus]|uniref:leucine-rich repeat-containing protein 15-like n=1 Tax=Uloborus diversus TaxID=327109 RepID=UPI0024095D2D|nr:leucine-rich repeat-containing protein 15-like [Uloborus diversus]